MGYYAHTQSIDFVIPATALTEAYERLVDESRPVDLGWWDENDEHTVAAVLRKNGFETYINDGGALIILYFDGKYSEQGTLLQVLGEFAQPGWSAIFVGEDDEAWKIDATGETGMDLTSIEDAERMRSLLRTAVFLTDTEADTARNLIGLPTATIYQIGIGDFPLGYTLATSQASALAGKTNVAFAPLP